MNQRKLTGCDIKFLLILEKRLNYVCDPTEENLILRITQLIRFGVLTPYIHKQL